MKFGIGSTSYDEPHHAGRDSLFEDKGASHSREVVDPEERLQLKFDQCFDQAADEFQQFDTFDGFDEVEFIDDRA